MRNCAGLASALGESGLFDEMLDGLTPDWQERLTPGTRQGVPTGSVGTPCRSLTTDAVVLDPFHRAVRRVLQQALDGCEPPVARDMTEYASRWLDMQEQDMVVEGSDVHLKIVEYVQTSVRALRAEACWRSTIPPHSAGEDPAPAREVLRVELDQIELDLDMLLHPDADVARARSELVCEIYRLTWMSYEESRRQTAAV